MTSLDVIDSTMDGIEERVGENFDAVSPAGAFARHASASSALHLALYGGISPLSGNDIAAYSHDFSPSNTYYVQLNADDTFTVTATSAPTGWPNALVAGAWAVGVAVAGASTYTWTDVRRFGATKASILAALGIDQFDVTSTTVTIGLAGKIIILPLE